MGSAGSPAVGSSPHASDRLAEEMRRRIQSGQWPVGMRLPSVRDLARQFEVSVNTVQRAMSQLQAERIVLCRERHPGYVMASSSHVMATQTPATSAVVVLHPEPQDVALGTAPAVSWRFGILAGAEQALAEQNFHLIHLSRANGVGLFPDQLASGAIGVICFEGAWSLALAQQLDERQIPWVVINRPHRAMQHNFVTADHLGAGLIAGRICAHQGMTRVLMMGPNASTGTASRENFMGLSLAFMEAGLPQDSIQCICDPLGELTLKDWGHRHFLRHLDEHQPPQVVFSTGDWTAIGVLSACQQRGLSVPGDVSVIGATGLPIAARSHPPLTVLAQPVHQIGRSAVEMLLVMRRKGQQRVPGMVLPTRLETRGSARLPRNVNKLIEQFQTNDAIL